MTLYRKILLMILVFFILMLGMVYTLEFNSTRDYLTRQQESDVQNTATTLGLSLAPHLESGDQVAIESLINAVFDGGYYQAIEVQLLEPERTVARRQSPVVQGVPQWFTALQLFTPVSQSQVLTSGWMQYGELRVVGHPGYAYLQLWQLMSQMLLWFLAAFVLFWVLMVIGLKQLLSPLKLLQERSHQIERQEFGEPLPEPRIIELRAVVRAFNKMATRLQTIFKKQAEETESLRKQAFQDPVTGLGNRLYFDTQMQQWFTEPGQGALLLVSIPYLDQLYQEQGYQARDSLVCDLETVISEQLRPVSGAVISRVSVQEFAAILPGLDADQVDQLAQQLVSRAEQVIANPLGTSQPPCTLGAAIRVADSTASRLFSQADLALQQAVRDPVIPYQVHQPDSRQVVLGREGWKQLTLHAMERDWVDYLVQEVPRVSDRQPLYRELFSCITKEGVRYSAGQFMPFVEQFGLGARFDRYVLERVVGKLEKGGTPVMINLSGDSIADAGFIGWLKGFLSQQQRSGIHLVVEITEEAAIRHRTVVGDLFNHCRALQIGCGIDRVGHYFDKLTELAQLKPWYLKMDVSYLLGDQVDSHFLRALANLSDSQGIDIIASRVETEAQLQALGELPVKAYQGYIQPPREMAGE